MSRKPAVRDRHVLVTGGSSGIGLALVRRLVSMGARVSTVALDNEDLERLRGERDLGGLCVAAADVSDREQTFGAIASCVERHGPVEVLVTSAGIVRPGYFMDLADSEFEREIRVNYLGTVWAVRAVVPSMIERRSGSIVAISSFAALLGVFGMGAYTPSKYAVRGLMETLRLELKPHGIHVACVFPTDVDTPMLAAEVPLHPPEQDAMQGTVKPVSPEVVVDAILDGLARKRPRIYPGRTTPLLARIVGAAPEVTARVNERLIRKAALKRS